MYLRLKCLRQIWTYILMISTHVERLVQQHLKSESTSFVTVLEEFALLMIPRKVAEKTKTDFTGDLSINFDDWRRSGSWSITLSMVADRALTQYFLREISELTSVLNAYYFYLKNFCRPRVVKQRRNWTLRNDGILRTKLENL